MTKKYKFSMKDIKFRFRIAVISIIINITNTQSILNKMKNMENYVTEDRKNEIGKYIHKNYKIIYN